MQSLHRYTLLMVYKSQFWGKNRGMRLKLSEYRFCQSNVEYVVLSRTLKYLLEMRMFTH